MSLLFWRTIFFCVTEICLTLIGLDDLADYSEYTFRVKETVSAEHSTLAEYECNQDKWGLVCRRQFLMVSLHGRVSTNQ